MQFLIDTATDEPRDLAQIGIFLVQKFGHSMRGTPNAPPVVSVPVPVPGDIPPPPPAPVVETAAPAIPPPPNTPPPPTAGDDDEDESDQGAPGVATIPPPPAIPPAAAPQQPRRELDSAGAEWDPNVHAANKAKTIAGAWKAKRKGSGAGNVPPAPTAAPPAPAAAAVLTVTAPQPGPTLAAALTPPVIPPTPAPAAQPPGVPPGAPPGSVTSFRNIMLRITAATKAGKLTSEQVDAGLVSLGLQAKALTALAGRADLVPAMAAYLDGLNVPN